MERVCPPVFRPDGVDLRLILPTARDAAGRCSNQGRCCGPETYRRDKDRGDRRYSGQGKSPGHAMVSDRIRVNEPFNDVPEPAAGEAGSSASSVPLRVAQVRQVRDSCPHCCGKVIPVCSWSVFTGARIDSRGG